MRVDAYARVQQLYNSSKPAKVKKSDSKVSFSDQLQISNMGKDFQVAKNAVKNSPDIREDVVADIKNRMDAGTYQVDSDSFAEKLFERYSSAIF